MSADSILGALWFREYGGGALVLLAVVFFALTHCSGGGGKKTQDPERKAPHAHVLKHHPERSYARSTP